MKTFFRFLAAACTASAVSCSTEGDGTAQLGLSEANHPVEQAAQVCGRGPTVPGIDVSSWQGSINWSAVAGAGYRFAIARIGDGHYRDANFQANWAGIRANGLIRGSYQFFRPSQDVVSQADIVVAAVGMLGPGDLPVTCDVEAPSPGVTHAQYVAAIHAWSDRVQQGTGRAPMIYTGFYYWRDEVGGTADFADRPLWHAQYTSAACPTIANAWGDWTFWQYSSTGSVPGISGNVDMNRFNGTLDDLSALALSNRPPVGYLDGADCDAIRGWTQDPDAPNAAIAIHVYIDGPAGDPGAKGFPLTATVHRDDLCAAIGSCNHGFDFPTPRSFLDGNPHSVFAYGIDSAGGNNPLLGNAPRTLQCARPTPPVGADRAVRRHVPNPDVMGAWHFGWLDVAPLTDAVMGAYADGPDVVSAPGLVQAAGDPAVYLLEGDTLRHVPSPAAMDLWHLDWGAIQAVTPANLATHVMGTPLPERPFLAAGSGPAIWLLDDPPPLWGVPVSGGLPTALAAGSRTTATWTVKNRGSVVWQPGAVWVVPVGPRGRDSALCDSTWTDCRHAATVATAIAPGATATFTFTLHAPAAPAALTECFGLTLTDAHPFSAAGQGGPADTAMCATVIVGAGVVPADGGFEPADAGSHVVVDAGSHEVADAGSPPAPDAGTAAPSGPSSSSGSGSGAAQGSEPGEGGCRCAVPRDGGWALVGMLAAAAALGKRRR